ncbi:hypothetical protein EHW97_14870 [Aeromicrobium camelliae]|uniref:DUF8175 domain-containing protein n=1 Tax=Aeromicrobium camelliae TaxID=1538144 RepID=A0A3N6WJS7_9ACTN|nr:hypothetical protein [Aeromicrobium camelliae]RQN02035.1 hypothetical protein EHW97_14870 [Aeromicrobium camelliae]
MVVVLGLVLALTGGDDEPSGDQRPPSADDTTATDSICGLPNGDLDVLRSAPDTEWELVDGVAAPTIEDAGPGEESQGIHSCFAHSAEGALLAAAYYRLDAASDEVEPDAFTRTRLDPDDPAYGEPAPSRRNDTFDTRALEFAGFRFDSISAESAVITTAHRVKEGPAIGELVTLTNSLTWRDGDWYLTSNVSSSQIGNLSGFVEWRP